jgi:hypothetical protein
MAYRDHGVSDLVHALATRIKSRKSYAPPERHLAALSDKRLLIGVLDMRKVRTVRRTPLMSWSVGVPLKMVSGAAAGGVPAGESYQ